MNNSKMTKKKDINKSMINNDYNTKIINKLIFHFYLY